MPSRRNQVPRRVAQRYFRDIKELIETDKKRVREAFKDEIRPRIHEYRRESNSPRANSLRVNDSLDEIRDVLDRLRRDAEEQTFNTTVLERLAEKFTESVNEKVRSDFRKQVRRILPFDPTANEPWLESFMKTAVRENVSFIKSIASEYHDRVENIVTQGVRRGRSINDISKDIAHQGKVEISRARFIARDQVGSIHGDLTKRRQEELGLDRFEWSTSRDERVRGKPGGRWEDAETDHWRLDGEIFTWKDGATNERGEQIWPGTDYNCRCVALPVEDDLKKIAEEHNNNAA